MSPASTPIDVDIAVANSETSALAHALTLGSSMRFGSARWPLAVVAAVALAASAWSVPIAVAQTSSAVELQTAKKLFGEAAQDETAEHWEAALQKLQQVAAIKETAGVRFHMGNCQEQLKRLVAALDSFQRAQQLAHAGDVQDVLDTAPVRIDALISRIPTVTIRVALSVGVQVNIDGKPLDATQVGTPVGLDPGRHEVRVEFPASPPVIRNVNLSERQAETLDIAPPPSPGPSASGAALQDSGQPSVLQPSHPIPATAWIAWGGAVVLGVGGWLAYHHAGSVADDSMQACAASIQCDPARASTVHHWDGAALGLWIGGVAAVGIGVVLALRNPTSSSPTNAAVVLSPSSAHLKVAF